MAYKYLEPTIAPRGQEITSIAARQRIIANARLVTYRIPQFDNTDVGSRQVVKQSKNKPLAPYTSPVSEGLLNLVNEEQGG